MRLAFLTLTVAALAAPSLGAQVPLEGGVEARVWLDRGDEPVLRRGETVRIYYRTTQDAYAAIFRIDTDGRISLVFPQDPLADAYVEGGRDYRLMLPNSPVWRVGDDPGVGYFFMVGSPEPLDFSAFPFDPEYGWDLAGVGDVVYEDPYIAIDQYVAELIPNWESVPYALDFITYNVGDTYTYPRFLCYDCHDARPYASWNPYAVPCTTFRVVIWDDPYFYPYYRYAGTRVVVARPLVTQPRYAVAARAPGDSYRPLVRSRAAPPRTVADFKEPARGTNPTATPRRVSPEPSQAAPRPTLQRRPDAPSSRLPVRTPPPSRSASPSVRSGQDPRAVRPSSPGATPTTRPANRPPTSAPPSPTTNRGATGGGTATPTRPSARPSAPARSGAQPSTPTRPSVQPSLPSRPSAQPTTRSRPQAQPSAPSRPTTQPSTQGRPSTQPSTPSRPSARPAAPSRPSTGSPPARPTVQPRPNTTGRPRRN